MQIYESLPDVIPAEVWERFDFGQYASHEQEILKPAMEAKGFNTISFLMGERDSFGPLTRIVRCYDKTGRARLFVYG
jgi:hypothetical protein